MKPKKQHTKSRSRKRRSAIKMTALTLTTCPKCKRPVKPHTACDFCGTYKNRGVLKIKLNKSERKKREQQEKDKKKEDKKKK